MISLAALRRQKQLAEHTKQHGDELVELDLQRMRDQLVRFKGLLERFAADHMAEIRSSPAFRAQASALH